MNELEHALDEEISRLAELGATTSANATNSEATAEHLFGPTAATRIDRQLSVPAPSLEPVHVEEMSLTQVNAMLPPPEPETFELSPVEPSMLESGTLDATTLVGEDIRFNAPEVSVEEIDLAAPELIVEEITLDAAAGGREPCARYRCLGGENITLDAVDLAGEDVGLDDPKIGATEAIGEEIVLGAVEVTPEEITLGETAGEVVEIEAGFNGLDTLQWSYENFPKEDADTAANSDGSGGHAGRRNRADGRTTISRRKLRPSRS